MSDGGESSGRWGGGGAARYLLVHVVELRHEIVQHGVDGAHERLELRRSQRGRGGWGGRLAQQMLDDQSQKRIDDRVEVVGRELRAHVEQLVDRLAVEKEREMVAEDGRSAQQPRQLQVEQQLQRGQRAVVQQVQQQLLLAHHQETLRVFQIREEMAKEHHGAGRRGDGQFARFVGDGLQRLERREQRVQQRLRQTLVAAQTQTDEQHGVGDGAIVGGLQLSHEARLVFTEHAQRDVGVSRIALRNQLQNVHEAA